MFRKSLALAIVAGLLLVGAGCPDSSTDKKGGGTTPAKSTTRPSTTMPSK